MEYYSIIKKICLCSYKTAKNRDGGSHVTKERREKEKKKEKLVVVVVVRFAGCLRTAA